MKKVSSMLLGTAVIAAPYFAACNYTVGECYPRGQDDGNSGAGAGVVVSTGVGASGDVPPKEPQNVTYPEAECNSDAEEQGTYIRCRGLGPVACEEACFNIGAYCVAGAEHPYGSMAGGLGNLKQCQSNTLNYTCTYCFTNGDSCTRTKLKLAPPFWLCSYTGGKGCD